MNAIIHSSNEAAPRCSQRSLAGSQCFDFAGHRSDCDFGQDRTPTREAIDAINWALANDWVRQSVEIGQLKDKNRRLETELERLRLDVRTRFGS